MVGQGVDALAHDGDVRMALNCPRDLGGKAFAVDRQRRSGRDLVAIRRAHDERAKRAHFLMEQPDRIVLGVVRAEAVGADHFREAVGVMGRSGVAAAPHLAEADAEPGFGKLPCGFGPCEAAADDVDVECHW